MMIVIGGLGFIHGAFLGAIVIAFLPQVLSIDHRSASFGARRRHSGAGIGRLRRDPDPVHPVRADGLYGRWLKIRTFSSCSPSARKDMFKRQKSYLKTERLR